MKDAAVSAVENPKIAMITSAVVTYLGALASLDWLPHGVLAKLSLLAGIALSCVLIIVHLKKLKLKKLEIQILTARESDRIRYEKMMQIELRRKKTEEFNAKKTPEK